MNHRILNLGAGTQSSLLAIMCDRGDVEPVEVAIFADTQAEPKEVYDHLVWLEKQLKNTPVVCVSAGNMRADALTYQQTHGGVEGRYASLPLYTTNGMQNRQCTKYYKIIPIQRYVRRAILKLGVHDAVPNGVTVTHVFGLHHDERQRMRSPSQQYVRNEYPLIEKHLGRRAVIALAEKLFPDHTFPRSACIECPYRSDDEWMSLPADEFELACQIDEQLRAADERAGSSGVFLHKSKLPLRRVQFDISCLWDGVTDNECEGLCGV